MSKLSRKKKDAPAPTKLTLRDKAMLIGVPILLLAIPALVLHFSSIRARGGMPAFGRRRCYS